MVINAVEKNKAEREVEISEGVLHFQTRSTRDAFLSKWHSGRALKEMGE